MKIINIRTIKKIKFPEKNSLRVTKKNSKSQTYQAQCVTNVAKYYATNAL